jgi:hypothetical protein
MERLILWLIVLAAIGACANPAPTVVAPERAQVNEPLYPQNEGDLTLSPVSEFSERPWWRALLGKVLFETVEADDAADWPASFFSEDCLATQVGPSALLTAAHCVGHEKFASIPALGVSGPCKHPTAYIEGNKSADLALCRVEVPGITYERINDRADRLSVGDQLLLLRLGCDEFGHPGERLLESRSTIEDLPAGENHSIRLDAILCDRESGGGAFIEEGAQRRLAAVNAKVVRVPPVSSLASVTTQSTLDFLRGWDSPICGIDPEAPNCRN